MRRRELGRPAAARRAEKTGSGGRQGRGAVGRGRAEACWSVGDSEGAWGCVRSTPQSSTMVGRSGYRALPLGDLDRFQQSSFGFLGSPRDYLFPEPGSVGPGAGELPPHHQHRGPGRWWGAARTLFPGEVISSGIVAP